MGQKQRLAILAAVLCLGLVGCATRPLVISPRLRPLDTSPARPHDPLVLVSFQDAVPKDEVGRKRFREQPIDVFNDTLLVALRTSQIFNRVVRGSEPPDMAYRLTGVIRSLKTNESAFKFGLVPSTMGITAACVVSVRLVDLKTSAVLLDDTLTTSGKGQARIHGGGQNVQYDSTSGYEESLSQAISDAVSMIVKRVAEAMPR